MSELEEWKRLLGEIEEATYKPGVDAAINKLCETARRLGSWKPRTLEDAAIRGAIANDIAEMGLDTSTPSKTAQGIVGRLAGDLSLMTHGCSYQEYHRRMKCLRDNLQREFMDPNLGRIGP